MKSFMAILLCTAISFSNLFALSDDAQEGKSLYIEAKCNKCHYLGMGFDPKVDDELDNKFELNKWVKSCANYFNIAWFPEEEEQVIKYLDEVYYKLEK